MNNAQIMDRVVILRAHRSTLEGKWGDIDRLEAYLRRAVRNAGIDVPPEGRGLALVFQSYALWPHRTVFDAPGHKTPAKGGRRKTPDLVGGRLRRNGGNGTRSYLPLLRVAYHLFDEGVLERLVESSGFGGQGSGFRVQGSTSGSLQRSG